MLQTTTGFCGGFSAFPGLDRRLDVRFGAHVNFGVMDDLFRMFMRQDNHAIIIAKDQVTRPNFNIPPDTRQCHRLAHCGVFPLSVRIDGGSKPAPDRNRPDRQRLPVPDSTIQKKPPCACAHHAGHHIVADDGALTAFASRNHHNRPRRDKRIEKESRQSRLVDAFPAFGAQGKPGHSCATQRLDGRSKHLRLQTHRHHDVRDCGRFKFRQPFQQWLVQHEDTSLQLSGKLDTSPPLIYHSYINKPALPMPREATRRPGIDGERTISSVPQSICDTLRALGLASPSDLITGEPLTGGVSSDIWRVDLPDGPVCAKRALAKLKVAEDWFAPTNRIDFEAAYYRFASAIEPGVTPAVLGHRPELGVLVTEYLSPSTHTVWKEDLRKGIVRPGHIRQLGHTLRRLHDVSRTAPQVAETFNQPDLIHALRLSPYFLASIQANSDLDAQLSGLVELFDENRHWLIHGDFSPKNILFGPDHPVILDAECATLGDAAFDIAFCSAHLLLKAAWKPEYTAKFKEAFFEFRNSYFTAGEDPDFDGRSAKYLAGFLLARIDGKSPVEYITSPADKARIRAFAREYLKQPANSLRTVADAWFADWADRSNKNETPN